LRPIIPPAKNTRHLRSLFSLCTETPLQAQMRLLSKTKRTRYWSAVRRPLLRDSMTSNLLHKSTTLHYRGVTMNRILIATTIVIPFLVLTGHAQEKKGPPEQIRKLEAILGTFEGEATLMEGGKSSRGMVHHTNASISDGWGFLMEEVITMEDGTVYKSHNIIGYDAGGGKVHVFSVTNAGETHDHKGAWTKPTTVSVEYDGKWEGKSYIEKASLTLDGTDAYTLTWISSLGGKKAGSGEEKLHRVNQ
jgi:hypothetical protein